MDVFPRDTSIDKCSYNSSRLPKLTYIALPGNTVPSTTDAASAIFLIVKK